jgi:cytochrome P450
LRSRCSIAGAETTATLISFILFFISTPVSNQSGEGTPTKSNHSQERLFAELSSLVSLGRNKDTDEQVHQPSFRDIDTSPYLEAIVKEGLRLRGSAPAVGLRVVPPGKALFIQGNWIPEGTEIGVQPWSMHRKKSVWEKPDEFIPERWLPSNLGGWGLDPGSDSYDQMNKHYMPFGVGTRVCAGRNMAMIIIKIVVASFVLRFEIKADEKETNAKTMAPRDTHVVSFFSIPR